MAVTKGRYQTKVNTTISPLKWYVIDTQGKTLGERFMCICSEEKNADMIANALEFQFQAVRLRIQTRR